MFPDKLNQLVNIVNALLGLLLPFAFTPLVKYNCTESIMGEGRASKGIEKAVLYLFALAVWGVNAMTISMPGGGFFGDVSPSMEWSIEKILLVVLQVAIQVRAELYLLQWLLVFICCSHLVHFLLPRCGMPGGTFPHCLDQ